MEKVIERASAEGTNYAGGGASRLFVSGWWLTLSLPRRCILVKRRARIFCAVASTCTSADDPAHANRCPLAAHTYRQAHRRAWQQRDDAQPHGRCKPCRADPEARLPHDSGAGTRNDPDKKSSEKP